MSNEQAKYLNSRRRHKTDVAIARQIKIAKSHNSYTKKLDREPHRLAKHNAMDCGNPGCCLCGNPRRNSWYKKDRLTNQEQKLFQDLDKVINRHGNGIPDKDEE
jgi:hypothetical protein